MRRALTDLKGTTMSTSPAASTPGSSALSGLVFGPAALAADPSSTLARVPFPLQKGAPDVEASEGELRVALMQLGLTSVVTLP